MTTPLPPPEILATLVSNVTQTMLGISFSAEPAGSPQALRWKTAVLPIPGERPITVGLSSDRVGCSALSARMFSCPESEVDAPMVEDSLRELVNMTAGLVKGALRLDQALGLPKIFSEENAPPEAEAQPASVVLKAKGLGLVLWIYEGLVN